MLINIIYYFIVRPFYHYIRPFYVSCYRVLFYRLVCPIYECCCPSFLIISISMRNTFFHPFTFIMYASLVLMWISLNGSFLKIKFYTLCFLFVALSPLSFKVILKKIKSLLIGLYSLPFCFLFSGYFCSSLLLVFFCLCFDDFILWYACVPFLLVFMCILLLFIY